LKQVVEVANDPITRVSNKVVANPTKSWAIDDLGNSILGLAAGADERRRAESNSPENKAPQAQRRKEQSP
jgi:hypothetical protein